MIVYADESGNTGISLFDENQRHYYTCAVMSCNDIDERHTPQFNDLANRYSCSCLHATELGAQNINRVIPFLKRVVKREQIQLFFGHIDKHWLAQCQLFDHFFDPYLNPAVPLHVYLSKQLRYLLLIKLSQITELDDLKNFWNSLICRSYEESEQSIKASFAGILSRVQNLPDQRSRDLVVDGLSWALQNLEKIPFHWKGKNRKLRLSPNTIIFPPLMQAVQKQSEIWGTEVETIRHDQQAQFGSQLRDIHAWMSDEEQHTKFQLWGGDEISLRCATNSRFEIASGVSSAGIQLADLSLWLFKRRIEKNDVSPIAQKFLNRVVNSKRLFELSYDGTVDTLETELPVMTMGVPEDQLKAGFDLVDWFEKKKEERLRQFTRDSD